MATDIDDLLDWMNKAKMTKSDRPLDWRAAEGDPLPLWFRHEHDANCFARWIAAVEELRERKSVVSFITDLVEAEPELAGMMPVSLHKYPPEALCRATVRATKKGILTRLRESVNDGDPTES
ncbi:hypothetical protein LCGC14_1098380 [marine sediment metagenome]|uniref:Uncharacterized protein n=1 Tax=marine sediment metagenome TaxID=412755 RepID=A0A0F9MES1_9ZZZZ